MAEHDRVNLRDLNQIFTVDEASQFLVQKNGKDSRIIFTDLMNQAENDLKDSDRNFGWNARFFDNVPINSMGTDNYSVMIYRDNENAFISTRIIPDHINWNNSITDNRFLRLDSNFELISDDVEVADLVPSSDFQDYSDKFLVLRVSDDGKSIYEFDFDTSQFITQPTDNVDDLNDVKGDHHKVGTGTNNRPETDGGYVINVKSNNYDSQSQIFFSTDSDKIRYRRHDGTQFRSWITVYNDSENPLSDSVSKDSSTHIATSKAVKIVKDDLTALDNKLTPTYFLNNIKQVDGKGSDLNADKLHDISGDEYATMFDTTNISKLPEKTVRFNHNTRIFEEKSGGSWQNLLIHGDSMIDAEIGKKGSVQFSDIQEARNRNNTKATTPDSVHAILALYGIGVNSDPNEEVDDADVQFRTGHYGMTSAANGNPFSKSSSLLVMRPGKNSWVHQLAIEGESGLMKLRAYDGNIWKSWQEYINTEEAGTAGTAVLKSETPEEARLNIGLDVGTTGFELIESETPSDARTAINMAESDTVEFDNVTIKGNDVYHKGNLGVSDSRTSTDTDVVLNSKGINDHRQSGDHDQRYYTKQEVDNLLAQVSDMPTGGIIMWSGTVNDIPVGFTLCDGSNASPDLRNRFIVGAGTSYNAGSTGGESSVQLTINEMPSHGHNGSTNNAGNHSHSGNTNNSGNHRHEIDGNNGNENGQASAPHITADGKEGQIAFTEFSGNHSHSFSTNSSGSHNHSVSINSTGGNGSHENRPPYYALAYIMKL